MNQCIKQKTICIIIREDGTRFEATNTCEVLGTECPRVAAGCKTGFGYDLCGSSHAEVNAAKMAEETKHIPGRALLIGHTWMCKECQDALRAVNVNTFTIL